MRTKAFWDKRKGRLIFAVILLVCAVFFAFMTHISTNTLNTQQAASRWADRGFHQLSAFVPEHHGFTGDFHRDFSMAMEGSFAEQSLNTEDAENAWTFAYHADGGIIEARSLYRGPVDAYAFGIGGNFFFFYPVTLISGSYLPVQNANRDMVMIDEQLAWQLFGATDVAGMELVFHNRPYVISGVFRHFDDRFSQAARLDLPQIFFYYDALEHLVSRPAHITTVKVVLPNPITGLAEQLLTNTLESAGLDEGDYLLVNHTTRYRMLPLLRLVGDFGQRSMQETGMRLPPWENAARMTEDFATLYLLITLLLLFILFVMLCAFAVWAFQRRKWRAKDIVVALDNQREKKREAVWRMNEERRENIENKEAFTVEQILRESRESEENDEKDV